MPILPNPEKGSGPDSDVTNQNLPLCRTISAHAGSQRPGNNDRNQEQDQPPPQKTTPLTVKIASGENCNGHYRRIRNGWCILRQ